MDTDELQEAITFFDKKIDDLEKALTYENHEDIAEAAEDVVLEWQRNIQPYIEHELTSGVTGRMASKKEIEETVKRHLDNTGGRLFGFDGCYTIILPNGEHDNYGFAAIMEAIGGRKNPNIDEVFELLKSDDGS